METETYKVKIKEREFILKKTLSGREEHLCGIKKFFNSFMGDGKINKDEMSGLIFDDKFHETSIKMIGYYLEYPKLNGDEIIDLPSDILLALKLETLMQYAESFKSLTEFMEKKKLMIQKPSVMDCSNFSEMNPNEVYDTLISQKNSKPPMK